MALSICNTTTDTKGRELIEHGTPAFPFACYYDDLLDESVPWHWHDEFEAAIITEGNAIINANSTEYLLSAGEAFFINANILHAATAINSTTCRFHSLVFKPSLVGSSVESIFWQKYVNPLLNSSALPIVCLKPNITWQASAINHIETAWQNNVSEPAGYEIQIRNSLSQLLFLINQYCPTVINLPTEKSLRDNKRIKIMLQYIHNNYHLELTTKKIAASIMVSDSECLRCFHNTIGITPIQYLKQYRLKKACELLHATTKSISTIGAECGFLEMSYFAKSFRQTYNCTPSDYRKKHFLFNSQA